MSEQLHKAVSEILAMPYFKNEAARSGGANYGHEEAVEKKILAAGFTKVEKTKDNFKGITKTLLKKWIRTGDDTDLRRVAAGLPIGSYISQPSGSQGSPDFLILDHGDRFVGIECKSGQSGLCPMWNDGLPGHSVIYVLSSGEMNQTTIFLGTDVLSEQEKELMEQQEREIAEVVKRYNDLSKALDKNNRGFIQKSRKQHFQQGSQHVTNYFIHPERAKCETNALEYAKQ